MTSFFVKGTKVLEMDANGDAVQPKQQGGDEGRRGASGHQGTHEHEICKEDTNEGRLGLVKRV